MTNDTSDRRGKPGPAGPARSGKDLDDLKARLGLKKGPEGAAGAAGAAGSGAGPAQSAGLDEFKFQFGAKPEAAAMLSDAELAAIDDKGRKATGQLGKWIGLGVAAVAAVVVVLWIGYQYGNSMGLRVLHNESVSQAQHVKDFFTTAFSDATGREVSSRRDATTVLADGLNLYVEERFAKFTVIMQALGEGGLPNGFDYEAFKRDDLDPLKKICEDYMTAVEEYSVDAMLQGQLYATEMGAKLLEFVNRANALRAKVEALNMMVQLLHSYALTPPPPANLKPKLLLLAAKAEKDKDQVTEVTSVEVNGTPEVDRELITRDVCEPISMEIEIPVCGAGKDDPQTEKRLLESFEKKQVQDVKPFRKVKVKAETGGKELTAKISDLFELDMRPYLMPLLERVAADRAAEAQNLALVFAAFFTNLTTIKETAEAVDYQSVIEVLDEFAGQETYFTL